MKTTMKKIAFEELLEVLSQIREEKYPEIPEQLLKDIIQAEYDNQDDPVEARKASRRVIDDFLKTEIPESEV